MQQRWPQGKEVRRYHWHKPDSHRQTRTCSGWELGDFLNDHKSKVLEQDSGRENGCREQSSDLEIRVGGNNPPWRGVQAGLTCTASALRPLVWAVTFKGAGESFFLSQSPFKKCCLQKSSLITKIVPIHINGGSAIKGRADWMGWLLRGFGNHPQEDPLFCSHVCLRNAIFFFQPSSSFIAPFHSDLPHASWMLVPASSTLAHHHQPSSHTSPCAQASLRYLCPVFHVCALVQCHYYTRKE